MRSFDDAAGHHWQAALMQASFGNVLMVFSRIGDDGIYKKPLATATLDEAEQLLAGADTAALQAMLAEAEPWAQPGA
ncbi:MAG TPA: hypothetical protein VFQ95_08220 [Rhodanobacteraceae bacterium]|nr:hypothetical protein [Rhodanobacteraceae bacterium]